MRLAVTLRTVQLRQLARLRERWHRSLLSIVRSMLGMSPCHVMPPRVRLLQRVSLRLLQSPQQQCV